MSILLAVVAFVLMEPFTALAHRLMMHGFGERLHRSHHRDQDGQHRGGWETNDWYPIMFAAVVNVGFLAGFNIGGLGSLVPIGVGITAYGAAYAIVHDVFAHGRLAHVGRPRFGPFDRLAKAHDIHHRCNSAPYGMLFPVVPRRLRSRVLR